MSQTPNRIAGQYNGEKGGFFMLTCLTTLLTIITFGIYRFWAKSRIRRYVWSATAPNNDPMEYTGTGTEKFVGFLIAMVFLAVYLGLVQLGLSFLGFAIWDTIGLDPESPEVLIDQAISGYVTILAILPLVLFARYRGRRYMLSRTRWRGVRFGMDKGAVGYALRGIFYGFLALITLGLLTPLMTFKLEKFMTDRTWYGDAQFEQEGSWTELYRSAIHIIFAALALIGVSVLAAMTGDDAYALLAIPAFIYLMIAFVFYRVDSFRRMARNKIVDDVMGFEAMPQTGFVIKTYIIGTLLTSLITTLAVIPIVLVVVGLGVSGFGGMNAADFDPFEMMQSPLFLVGGLLIVLVYFAMLALSSACANAFIIQPIYGHFVTTGALLNSKHLNEISQRQGDSMPDAEGFADALDVGGAF